MNVYASLEPSSLDRQPYNWSFVTVRYCTSDHLPPFTCPARLVITHLTRLQRRLFPYHIPYRKQADCINPSNPLISQHSIWILSPSFLTRPSSPCATAARSVQLMITNQHGNSWAVCNRLPTTQVHCSLVYFLMWCTPYLVREVENWGKRQPQRNVLAAWRLGVAYPRPFGWFSILLCLVLSFPVFW